MLKSRRYVAELGATMVAYALLLALSLYLLLRVELSQPLRLLVALLPMAACAVVPWLVVRELRRLDELQRRILLEALAFAFTGTALLTLGWGFLELAGVRPLPAFAVWPIMGALWMVGQALAGRRYR